MSETINYRKKVNQQIAGSTFQFSLLQDPALNLSALKQSSCRQAALYHLYTAIGFYINEVLTTYKREPVDLSSQPVEVLFAKGVLKQYDLVEFNELQQWYEKDNSLLAYLVELTRYIENEEQWLAKKDNNNDFIQLVAVDEPVSLLNNTKGLARLKNELLSVIDRQRESLLEH